MSMEKELNSLLEVLSTLQKNIQCVICLDMLKDPVMTRCGHSFCQVCINNVVNKSKKTQCPLCNTPITRRSMTEYSKLSQLSNTVRLLIEGIEQDTGLDIAAQIAALRSSSQDGPCSPKIAAEKSIDNETWLRRKKVKELEKASSSTPEIYSDNNETGNICGLKANINVTQGFPSSKKGSTLKETRKSSVTSNDCSKVPKDDTCQKMPVEKSKLGAERDSSKDEVDEVVKYLMEGSFNALESTRREEPGAGKIGDDNCASPVIQTYGASKELRSVSQQEHTVVFEGELPISEPKAVNKLARIGAVNSKMKVKEWMDRNMEATDVSEDTEPESKHCSDSTALDTVDIASSQDDTENLLSVSQRKLPSRSYYWKSRSFPLENTSLKQDTKRDRSSLDCDSAGNVNACETKKRRFFSGEPTPEKTAGNTDGKYDPYTFIPSQNSSKKNKVQVKKRRVRKPREPVDITARAISAITKQRLINNNHRNSSAKLLSDDTEHNESVHIQDSCPVVVNDEFDCLVSVSKLVVKRTCTKTSSDAQGDEDNDVFLFKTPVERSPSSINITQSDSDEEWGKKRKMKCKRKRNSTGAKKPGKRRSATEDSSSSSKENSRKIVRPRIDEKELQYLRNMFEEVDEHELETEKRKSTDGITLTQMLTVPESPATINEEVSSKTVNKKKVTFTVNSPLKRKEVSVQPKPADAVLSDMSERLFKGEMNAQTASGSDARENFQVADTNKTASVSMSNSASKVPCTPCIVDKGDHLVPNPDANVATNTLANTSRLNDKSPGWSHITQLKKEFKDKKKPYIKSLNVSGGDICTSRNHKSVSSVTPSNSPDSLSKDSEIKIDDADTEIMSCNEKPAEERLTSESESIEELVKGFDSPQAAERAKQMKDMLQCVESEFKEKYGIKAFENMLVDGNMSSQNDTETEDQSLSEDLSDHSSKGTSETEIMILDTEVVISETEPSEIPPTFEAYRCSEHVTAHSVSTTAKKSSHCNGEGEATAAALPNESVKPQAEDNIPPASTDGHNNQTEESPNKDLARENCITASGDDPSTSSANRLRQSTSEDDTHVTESVHVHNSAPQSDITNGLSATETTENTQKCSSECQDARTPQSGFQNAQNILQNPQDVIRSSETASNQANTEGNFSENITATIANATDKNQEELCIHAIEELPNNEYLQCHTTVACDSSKEVTLEIPVGNEQQHRPFVSFVLLGTLCSKKQPPSHKIKFFWHGPLNSTKTESGREIPQFKETVDDQLPVDKSFSKSTTEEKFECRANLCMKSIQTTPNKQATAQVQTSPSLMMSFLRSHKELLENEVIPDSCDILEQMQGVIPLPSNLRTSSNCTTQMAPASNGKKADWNNVPSSHGTSSEETVLLDDGHKVEIKDATVFPTAGKDTEKLDVCSTDGKEAFNGTQELNTGSLASVSLLDISRLSSQYLADDHAVCKSETETTSVLNKELNPDLLDIHGTPTAANKSACSNVSTNSATFKESANEEHEIGSRSLKRIRKISSSSNSSEDETNAPSLKTRKEADVSPVKQDTVNAQNLAAAKPNVPCNFTFKKRTPVPSSSQCSDLSDRYLRERFDFISNPYEDRKMSQEFEDDSFNTEELLKKAMADVSANFESESKTDTRPVCEIIGGVDQDNKLENCKWSDSDFIESSLSSKVAKVATLKGSRIASNHDSGCGKTAGKEFNTSTSVVLEDTVWEHTENKCTEEPAVPTGYKDNNSIALSQQRDSGSSGSRALTSQLRAEVEAGVQLLAAEMEENLQSPSQRSVSGCTRQEVQVAASQASICRQQEKEAVPESENESDDILEATPQADISNNGLARSLMNVVKQGDSPKAKFGRKKLEFDQIVVENQKRRNLEEDGKENVKKPKVTDAKIGTRNPTSNDVLSNRTPEFIQQKKMENTENSVNVPPHLSCQKLCFACSGLNGVRMAKIMTFAKMIGAEFSNSFEPKVTHLIVNTDEELRVTRTLKYLYGVAAKKWVVSFKWVDACMQSRRLLPEDKFEALDSTADNGPYRSRIATLGLFKNFEFCFFEPLVEITKSQLYEIVEYCGATVVRNPDFFSYQLGKQLFIITQTETEIQHNYNGWIKRYQVLPLSHEWIVECVARYRITSIFPYMPTVLSGDELRKLGYSEEILSNVDDSCSDFQ